MTNICLLASCGSIREDVRILQLLSVVQSVVVFAFSLAVLITAETFGSNPECNTHAVLVFLRPFRVFNAGRIIGGVLCGTVLVLYTFMTARDYLSPFWDGIKKNSASGDLPAGNATPVPSRTDKPHHIPESNVQSDIQDSRDAHLDIYAELNKTACVH